MFTALIIEDEQQGQDYLRTLLKEYPEIHVLEAASNVKEAVNLITLHNPSLLFLDVELGCQSGFDVLNEIIRYDLHPYIIFTTGYDKYAVEAIRHSAFDFLLKPIDPSELGKAILRLKADGVNGMQDKTRALFNHLDLQRKILFNVRTGAIFIDPDEIFYCEADGNYTYMFLSGHKKEYITCQIGHVLERLPSEDFVRLGRSIVMNKKHLSRIDRHKKQAFFEKNGDSYVIDLSVRQLRELSELLDGNGRN